MAPGFSVAGWRAPTMSVSGRRSHGGAFRAARPDPDLRGPDLAAPGSEGAGHSRRAGIGADEVLPDPQPPDPPAGGAAVRSAACQPAPAAPPPPPAHPPP